MPTITKIPAPATADMCFLGEVISNGSASAHTGYRIGFANGANYLVARVTGKTLRVKGKLTSASTGASVPRFFINGSEVLSGTGNPFYNNPNLTDATIYNPGTDETFLLEIYWPGSGIIFWLGTPTSGTTGFDGNAIIVEADGTPSIVCPPNLVGTPVKLDFTADAVSPTASKAHGELRGNRTKNFVIRPNATTVTVIQPAGLNAYNLTDTARNYAHTGSRADDTLEYHTVSLADPDPSLLDGSLITTIGMQAVRVAEGLTPGTDLWISVGNPSQNVSNPFWLILDGGTESLDTRNTFPSLWIGYDGGASAGMAGMPRFATEQGALGYNLTDGNFAFFQTYNDLAENRNSTATFGNAPSVGWPSFAAFVQASKSARVNLYLQLFSYEDNIAETTPRKYIAVGPLDGAGTNLVELTNATQLREQIVHLADAIRNGNNWFGSSVGAITKINEVVFAPYGNLAHNTYEDGSTPGAPFRVDAALYESIHGTELSNKYSNASRIAYKNAVEDAVTDINVTEGFQNLDGGPMAVWLDLGQYLAYVQEYDMPGIFNGAVPIPGVADGTWASRPFTCVTTTICDALHENVYGQSIKASFNLDAYLRVKGIITSAAPLILNPRVPEAGDRITVPFTRDVLNYTGLSFTQNGNPLSGTVSRVNTREYEFTLDSGVIYQGDTVTVSYNALSGDITELYGLEMATVSGVAVENDSTQEAPPEPEPEESGERDTFISAIDEFGLNCGFSRMPSVLRPDGPVSRWRITR